MRNLFFPFLLSFAAFAWAEDVRLEVPPSSGGDWTPCTCTNCVPGSCECCKLPGFPWQVESLVQDGRIATFAGSVGVPPSGTFSAWLRIWPTGETPRAVAECELGEDGSYSVEWDGRYEMEFEFDHVLDEAEWGNAYCYDVMAIYDCDCGCSYTNASDVQTVFIDDPSVYVWTGLGEAGLWTDPDNWNPAGPALTDRRGFPMAGSTAVFPDLGASYSVRLPENPFEWLVLSNANSTVTFTAESPAVSSRFAFLKTSSVAGPAVFSNVTVRAMGFRIADDADVTIADGADIELESDLTLGNPTSSGTLSFEGAHPSLRVHGEVTGPSGYLYFSLPVGGYATPPLQSLADSVFPSGDASVSVVKVRNSSPAASVDARCDTILVSSLRGFDQSRVNLESNGCVPYPQTDYLAWSPSSGSLKTGVRAVVEGHAPDPAPPVLTNLTWTSVTSSSATLRGDYRPGGKSTATVHFYLIPGDMTEDDCEFDNINEWSLDLDAPVHDYSLSVADASMEPETDYKLIIKASNSRGLEAVRTLPFTTLGGAAQATASGVHSETVSYGPYSMYRFSAGSSGSLTVTKGGPAEILVVGGGGAGGAGSGLPDALPGAGGAAGLVVCRSVDTLVPGEYSVSVGAGGAASNPFSRHGGSGGASSIENDSLDLAIVAAGGSGGAGDGATCPTVSSGTFSAITGYSLVYGVSGADGSSETPMGIAGAAGSGNGGGGGTITGGVGGSGIVIVRMRTVPQTDSPIVAFRSVESGIADATISYELFEFGYGAVSSELSIEFGEGESALDHSYSLGSCSSLGIASVFVDGLKPGTSYRARLVAANPSTGASWATDVFTFSTQPESRPQKDETVSVRGLRLEGDSLVSAVEVSAVRPGTLYLCYGSVHGGTDREAWSMVPLGSYPGKSTLLGGFFPSFPPWARYVRFVAIPDDPVATITWSETFARYELSPSDGMPSVFFNDAAAHSEKPTAGLLSYTILSAGEAGSTCDVYAAIGLSPAALSLTNCIAAQVGPGPASTTLNGLVPGRTYFVRLFAESGGVRSTLSDIRFFTTSLASDDEWDASARLAVGTPLLGGAFWADAMEAGDTATVHGLLRDVGTAPCTVQMVTSFAGDFSDPVSHTVSVTADPGPFSYVLYDADPSAPGWIEPGHAYAFFFLATDGTGAFDVSPTGVFSTPAAARVDEPVYAQASHRTVVFDGSLAQFGAGSSTTVFLWVGETPDSLEPVNAQILSAAGVFSFTNVFPKVCTSYYYAVVASNRLDSGLRSWTVSSRTNTVVTTDETLYTWKTSVRSGAWENADNWDNDRAGDCFGYPQSAEASAVFPQAVTANVSVAQSHALRAISFATNASVKLVGPADVTASIEMAPGVGLSLSYGLTLTSSAPVDLCGSHEFTLDDAAFRSDIVRSGDPEDGAVSWRFRVPEFGSPLAPLRPSPNVFAPMPLGSDGGTVLVEVDPKSPVFFSSHVTFDTPLITWPTGIETNAIVFGDLPQGSSFRWSGVAPGTGLPNQLLLRAYGNPATILMIR